MNTPAPVSPESTPIVSAETTDRRGHLQRVLMIAYNFPPAANAGVHRTLRFSKYLSEFGWNPTVLTRNCEPEASGDRLLAQVPPEVAIHRVGRQENKANAAPTGEGSDAAIETGGRVARSGARALLPPAAKTVLGSFRDLLTETPDQYIGWSRLAAKRATELCRQDGFDVVYTTGPPHSTHLAGLKVHQRTGIPWLADFRDPWARRPWSKARNPWGQRFFPFLESKVARLATCVVLNNEASAEDFRRAYPHLPAEKFVSIPNGYDPDLIPLTRQLAERYPAGRGSSGANRLPVFCHPGTLYGQRDPRALLEAIAQLHANGTDVRFQQIGVAAERYHPAVIAAELGIEHLVECLPVVPHAKVMEYMAQADVLVVIQPNGPLMVPGKLYEMLLFDKPLLGVCDSVATSQVIEAAGLGWVAASTDVSAIAQAVGQAVAAASAGPDPRRDHSRQQFNGRNLTAALSQVLQRCASMSRR